MLEEVFSQFAMNTGQLYDYSRNRFPTKLYSWNEGSLTFPHAEDRTLFGFVYAGTSRVMAEHNSYVLVEGQYFAIRDEALSIEGGSGMVIERLGYRGLNVLGGPIESHGRLRYIDGCTDSLLIPPVKLGDPCLNALYFPPNTDQTQHTHPSMRVGMVAAGRGECETPEGRTALLPGKIFIIHADRLHKFRTFADSSMTVIAYHPDSDFGPEDQNHPMINRTMVDGLSAAKIESTLTK